MNIDELEGLDDATRKEIEELQSITREKDGNDDYALAQLRIGTLLYDNNRVKESLSVWKNINETDSREIFIPAQWNISNVLMESGDWEGALLIWNSIEWNDDPEMYAQAQWNIGLLSAQAGNVKKAMQIWDNIKRTDSPQVYASAQLNIGLILFERENVEEALNMWNNVNRSDDSRKYAKANWIAGLALVGLNKIEEGLSKWYNIEITDDFETYEQAQFRIGIQLIEDNKHINDASIAFKNAKNLYPYESYCYIQICDFLLNPNLSIFGKKLQIFLNKIFLVIKELTLDFDDSNDKKKLPERKLAHYTGVDTVNKLISTDNKEKSPSSFRLNTINNVNDPSEGKLLNNYLNKVKQESFSSPDFDGNFHAFISCFTFNHDSLNQFRLYGKQDNKEASGVSLVFKKDFFQSENLFSGMSFISSLNSSQAFNSTIKIKLDDKNNKKPVMRCIYIEPESEYIHLAQRNCLTFYREFEIEENPEEEWNNYKKNIDNKNVKVKAILIKLKIIYQSLKVKHTSDFNKHCNFIDKTLLPLKYLMKHSAFQEEQECRMVYMTSLDDEKVKMDFGRFLYVEYEADVKSNLDKVYIAPAATQYQPYLAKLLCNSNVKIELSNNPYRQI